jgi:hypothetical protein
MTREDLSKLLEQFAICAISVSIVPEWTVEEKEKIITDSIDTVVETVMFCTDKKRVLCPSAN